MGQGSSHEERSGYLGLGEQRVVVGDRMDPPGQFRVEAPQHQPQWPLGPTALDGPLGREPNLKIQCVI